jgi:hypothetical protein
MLGMAALEHAHVLLLPMLAPHHCARSGTYRAAISLSVGGRAAGGAKAPALPCCECVLADGPPSDERGGTADDGGAAVMEVAEPGGEGSGSDMLGRTVRAVQRTREG